MPEKEVSPNVGFSMQNEFNQRRAAAQLPKSMHDLIHGMLKEFEFDVKRTHDVSRYILGANVDMALEDCVPLKAFFGMCANKYEEKHDAIAEEIKIMLEGGVQSSSKEKVTAQKGRIKNSKKYRILMAKKIRYARMRRDCRTLEDAMEMRMSIAQTKSANYRIGMTPGAYTNISR